MSNSRLLREIYDEHGPHSKEFHDQAKNFMIFVMRRCVGWYSDDLLQDCWLRFYNSIEHFSPEKKLNTFIFSCVRNSCSKYLSTMKRVGKTVFVETVYETPDYREVRKLEIDDFLLSFMSKIKTFKVVEPCEHPALRDYAFWNVVKEYKNDKIEED